MIETESSSGGEPASGWQNCLSMLTYQILEKRLGLDTALPVAENWSAAADFLSMVSDFCLHEKPETVVECSSGTSSLVLAQCCKINQAGHVYSLENGAEFASQTRQHLEDFFLADYCDVLHTPLQLVELNGEEFQWYNLEQFPKLEIDMLVIDGPPGFLQKYSRYPALPLLVDMLAEKCAVFLDDALREDEQEIVRRWLRDYPEFRVNYIDNERGCFILER